MLQHFSSLMSLQCCMLLQISLHRNRHKAISLCSAALTRCPGVIAHVSAQISVLIASAPAGVALAAWYYVQRGKLALSH